MPRVDRPEIGRLGRGYIIVDSIIDRVYAANVCRRVVTVEWDGEKQQLVYRAIVPAAKKIAIAIETKKK